ncbi:2-C-methyl-D-erythritol 4-phosphate cytidylyltransferase [Mediterraneibacter glycyrrhizinilyticus]|uniref:2-C-methyl-D-erythritol 4-phosphate cytidylyltransferase n=1 Tax=Candidatus Mediterraneibacter faecipullorum TaxID=2838670 RepID=A0A9D2NKF2_9FIRM|nr:2-C-methyl-D-erythritol 4-phosphate cytidylyltransferase [Mediterraneibacter glycyrrhizinilyticus]MDM8126737.1 2-C-methyl-D-erythritol 4-phosphate cytidylyltransferase [Mediterraneibacter glycyrrhizinilyticus]HJC33026.1 2-C-methyl-D-erythritol 4-phosphate cytidylyltransferase [Candidatus Mediterraneibacter faecipullorum]
MEKKEYCTAIVLAAGSGKRMGTKVHKQYLLMGGKPVLYYSLRAFEDSKRIDEIILVCGAGEEDYCRKEIVEKYGISKARKIIPGGAERYDSVWNGLKETKEGYVYIHDGARPFVDEEIIERAYECVSEHHACVAGMPSKDTVKIADSGNIVTATPDRSSVWIVQTPQVFDTELIRKAYALLMEKDEISVTDDAMVAEQMLGASVRLFYGSYENIKITTPEDLEIAEVFLKRKS